MDVVLSYQGFCTETGKLSLTTALPNKKETGAIPCLDNLQKHILPRISFFPEAHSSQDLIPPPDTPTPNHSSRLS